MHQLYHIKCSALIVRNVDFFSFFRLSTKRDLKETKLAAVSCSRQSTELTSTQRSDQSCGLSSSAVKNNDKSYSTGNKDEQINSDIPDVIVLHRTDFLESTNTDSTSKVEKGQRLIFTDYNIPGLSLARKLLGTTVVRVLDSGKELRGKIVEAEAYMGVHDGACHCYGGKKTPRNATMFMPPGTAYVYNIYFMYCCFNISCQGM